MNIVRAIIIAIAIIIGIYIFGRIFAKGVLHEFDSFLGKKFVDYINNKKEKQNGTEKKE